VIFVCEDNSWAISVAKDKATAVKSNATRAAAYGIEGITVNGNDVQAVCAATREAAAKIRETKKPIVLELETYRMKGHYEPDDQAYVDPAELAAWALRDPIETAKAALLEQGVISAADADAMQARSRKAVEDALAFAQASPFPDASELTTDVYA
jgi:pyruvate dehydrogenase E1 component alpha subunit